MEVDTYDSPPDTEGVVSVLRSEAFTTKHMPDLGHVAKEFRAIHWKVRDWTKLGKKLYGPEFDCGGYKWRILLFPSGNGSPPDPTVSLYLECVDPQKEGWHVCAQFALAMSNPSDPTTYTVSHAHHRFIAEEIDWGFTRFAELSKLLHPQHDQSCPVIEGDSSLVSVYVRVLEDSTGVLWHNFVNYDSKKHTGYVGLRNQGATSYMNCLLQSLFCIHQFRKAIYQIPTEGDQPTESIPLALQRVFYHLQTSDCVVGTTELTKSFGWRSAESFMQHDAQEFNRVLQDSLESKTKGTCAEAAIKKPFVGRIKIFTRCINVYYESSRIEEFHDIQLNVKGIKTLYDSFLDYVSVEMLRGENKFRAEGLGLQNAWKGVIFESLPPVLYLQLKRFEYDIQLDAMTKINDRFEFPFEIDLDEFLDETADRSEPWRYKLHGVLVHSGDVGGGHYFTVFKPGRDAQWLKFDDDRVTPVTDREVLEENYGGVPLYPVFQARADQLRGMKRFTNAYMLIYIRESAIDEVLAPLTEGDTPPHLKQGLDEEHTQIEARKKEREEQNSCLTVKVVTDRTFASHEGFDLATFEERCFPRSILPTFRVSKQELYTAFKSQVAHRFSYPENQIRLWVLVNRQNKTVRPDTHIPEVDPSLTIEGVHSNMDIRLHSELNLYLDFLPGPSMKNQRDSTGTIMILLKHFDTTRQTVYGVGKIHVQKATKVRNLIPIINKKMRWALSTQLKLYEEIKPGMVEVLRPSYTLLQSEIQDGDIICFQVEITDAEIHQLEIQGLYSNPMQYYDFLLGRVMVLFKPKFNDPDVHQPEFSLVLNKKQNYGIMATKAGGFLKHEPTKLRFTTTYPTGGAPKSIIKRSLNQNINEMVYASHVSSPNSVILYEKLHVSIVKLETKRTLKIIWTGIHNWEESTHLFLSSKTSMVYDLIDHLSKRVHLTPKGTGKIRVFEVTNGGRARVDLSESELIGNILDSESGPVKLFAEEIPREEMEVREYCKIVNVFHYAGDVTRIHGVPFKLVVKPGERFSETKRRLQGRLGVSEGDFSRFRFALVRMVPRRVACIEDSDIIYKHEWVPEDYLGLNHVDKTGRAGGANGIVFGRVRKIQDPEPVELFAEEIPRDDAEAADQDDLANVLRFTRDVARTHGISFKFGFPAGYKGPQGVQNN